MPNSIEVFQDLKLLGPEDRRTELRNAIVELASYPWRFDVERSEYLAQNASYKSEVLAFHREEFEDLPAAGLTLWGTEGGYYVPNVVPINFGQLSYKQYNRILNDFLEKIVVPAAPQFGFRFEITSDHQSLEDWISLETAKKLRTFSSAANKSTGASHPMDQKRWFDFLVSAHRTLADLDTERLARWLHEVENWDEDSAHKLAGNYENSRQLLKHYDQN
jgi:hypothetical protein